MTTIERIIEQIVWDFDDRPHRHGLGWVTTALYAGGKSIHFAVASDVPEGSNEEPIVTHYSITVEEL